MRQKQKQKCDDLCHDNARRIVKFSWYTTNFDYRAFCTSFKRYLASCMWGNSLETHVVLKNSQFLQAFRS